MSKARKQFPVQDHGFGGGAGVGKDKDWTAMEQDGQNKLLDEDMFVDEAFLGDEIDQEFGFIPEARRRLLSNE